MGVQDELVLGWDRKIINLENKGKKINELFFKYFVLTLFKNVKYCKTIKDNFEKANSAS